MSYMLALRQLEKLDQLEHRAARGRQPAGRPTTGRARMPSRPLRPAPMAAEPAPRGAEQIPVSPAGDAAVLWESLRRAPDRLGAAYEELGQARAALAAPNYPNPDSLQAAIERHAAAEDQIDAIHQRLQLDWEAFKSVSTFGRRETAARASGLPQDTKSDSLAAEAPAGLTESTEPRSDEARWPVSRAVDAVAATPETAEVRS